MERTRPEAWPICAACVQADLDDADLGKPGMTIWVLSA
jgi:hypothetical protein